MVEHSSSDLSQDKAYSQGGSSLGHLCGSLSRHLAYLGPFGRTVSKGYPGSDVGFESERIPSHSQKISFRSESGVSLAGDLLGFFFGSDKSSS